MSDDPDDKLIQQILSTAKIRSYPYAEKHYGKPSYDVFEYGMEVAKNAVIVTWHLASDAERQRIRKLLNDRLKYDTLEA